MKIKLTQNKFTIVDNEDFGSFNQYGWYAIKNQNTYYAAKTMTIQNQSKPKRKVILIHRLILEKHFSRKLKNHEEVDHINGNGLDNRKCNLRVCNHQQNLMNQKNTKGSSKYKGVSWHKGNKKWQSRTGVNYNRIHLGYFKNEIDAAKAYDQAAKKYFGEFARYNFNQ